MAKPYAGPAMTIDNMRALVQAGDINGIRLGEIAIDEFVTNMADPERQRKGLSELERAVTPSLSAKPSSQVEVADLLVSYIQSRTRALSDDQ
jgi:hypothetical protein